MTTIKSTVLAGFAVLTAVGMAAPAYAADLMGGSLKDDPVMASAPSRASCYVRGDIGYGWSRDPDATYIRNVPQENFDAAALTDAAFGELGFGCGSGVRGLRADVTAGWHREKEFEGHIPFIAIPDDPISTTVESLTSLVNIYYDLGDWGGFVPYVGGGVGVAFHSMGDVNATDPTSPNTQFGDDSVDFAWQLSAGFGYRVSDNMTFDLGYRYLDMGNAQSDSMDVLGFANPVLDVNVAEHEIKAGLRIDLGSMY